ncbi:class I SAM-dependent DNA methyltransferase [Streptomyces sp. NPDC051815]|uniref:class I SAM-dependent DNA methyltransferase n=1 Tax=Streptomyces sp. NPDC051815 TaxID=3365674 RepID=UPI0037B3A583
MVLVECKAKVSQHESADRSRAADFAVDGVLHYAKFVSREYTVVAVAVSGDEGHLKISTFLWSKGAEEPKPLVSPQGAEIAEIIPLSDYVAAASHDPAVQTQRIHDLLEFSQQMHEFMRDEAELEEKEKPLVVAGTLIALRNRTFALSYSNYKADELQDYWLETIQKEMAAANLPDFKKLNMTQPYTAVAVHPELGKATRAYPRGVLHEIIKMLSERVMPFITIYHDFDVVGRFYGEFLKYTGGDGKGLGIVLTPRHVTELFALLSNVSKDDVVLDPCVGTGGFLISAMAKMISTTTTAAEVEDIKKNRLIGVEQQATMYALAASNMILRGDGKANLHQGSCFDSAISGQAKQYKANVGMVNPPYSKSKADLHELRFVEHMLEMLEPGGTGIAIVPVSCATSPSEHKGRLLRNHTLEAVMSMPVELFYPVGVVTCVMVFTAHKPHATSGRKTWFGYWREDGFVKTKHRGRIDLDDKWTGIRDSWVSAFRNREVIPGHSVTRQVTAADEWVAEAYMETDYSTLTPAYFEQVVREYALFQLGRLAGDEDATD